MYITEYTDAGFNVNVGSEPGLDQTVTFTTAAASAAFAPTTKLVRVHVDGIASIKFGTAPVATTANKRLAASTTEYFTVPVGQAFKVSAITNT